MLLKLQYHKLNLDGLVTYEECLAYGVNADELMRYAMKYEDKDFVNLPQEYSYKYKWVEERQWFEMGFIDRRYVVFSLPDSIKLIIQEKTKCYGN